MTPTSLVAYLVLFGSVGFLFLLVSLLLGRLLRPARPTAAKLEVYECGEPAVGSSFVQFDLRFYVVALVFIVFEVELALFFPPATIFGTATRWMRAASAAPASASLTVEKTEPGAKPQETAGEGGDAKQSAITPLGQPTSSLPPNSEADDNIRTRTFADARTLALAAAADLAVFFAVILLGFAYVWRRGDLDWVRAMSMSPSRPAQQTQFLQQV